MHEKEYVALEADDFFNLVLEVDELRKQLGIK